uniref:Reverse transcriptase domain-containing protein n=1 Tax=Amphimedon queenslandica TaxID=400682 RepID=A0A1X7T808_AMPQE
SSGVPQGSILGPLLFLVFINDVSSVINHSDLYLFADDSKLQQVSSSSYHLQEDINSLAAWSEDNFLLLNSHKCVAGRFSFSTVTSLPLYEIDGTTIPTLESHTDLGLMVRSDLSWSDHYRHISSKAYASLYLIKRSFSTVDVTVKKILYIYFPCSVQTSILFPTVET